MRITVESTDKIVTLNGVPARVWEGKTERGVPIHCFITRIAVHNDEDHSQFDAELKEQPAPKVALSDVVEAIPLRMIL